jgi:hypothetical protein
MKFDWKEAFSKVPVVRKTMAADKNRPVHIRNLLKLKEYLDYVHIRECLLRPYFATESYPVVESRELLPSFETDLFEYAELPGFSMVAFERHLDYFQEVFQFDILHHPREFTHFGEHVPFPWERQINAQNLQTVLDRLPKHSHDRCRKAFSKRHIIGLENYPELMRYILQMDRAHVMATNDRGYFHLAGVYASLPSDLDTEIKRFGLRIQKFTQGDNVRYEMNRLFVYQFLMELYGFPIVSERRTSAALFSRRLHRMGEKFLVRVLGQSDRTLTTLYSHPEAKRYPRLEKIALVQVDKEQKDALRSLGRGRYFVDGDKRVVIIRVTYKQHKYDPENVRQDRALSVIKQEVIHPLSGRARSDLNLIKDTSNMVLRLNDIVRGEYMGRIVFKRNEVVENTESHEKRLKFLYSWLSKHQRRIIGYSDEFYSGVVKVLDNYLLNPDNYDVFNSMHGLYQEVWSKYSYIQQARKVKLLEDLQHREFKQRKLDYLEMLQKTNAVMHDLKFEIVNYFDDLVQSAIGICENVLGDSYIRRNYANPKEEELSEYGREVRKEYGRLVSLVDQFKSIRKARADSSDESEPTRAA